MTIIVIQDTADHQCTRDTVSGVETWTWKPGTPGANQQIIVQHAAAALANNASYLAIGSPSQAQAVAQVGALTRQVNGLIRFLTNAFADASDS